MIFSLLLFTGGVQGGDNPVFNNIVRAGAGRQGNFMTQNRATLSSDLASLQPLSESTMIRNNNMDAPQWAVGRPRPQGDNLPGVILKEKNKTVGWSCTACTMLNPPQRPGCSACGAERPGDYVVPNNLPLDDVGQKAEESQRLFEQV